MVQFLCISLKVSKYANKTTPVFCASILTKHNEIESEKWNYINVFNPWDIPWTPKEHLLAPTKTTSYKSCHFNVVIVMLLHPVVGNYKSKWLANVIWFDFNIKPA